MIRGETSDPDPFSSRAGDQVIRRDRDDSTVAQFESAAPGVKVVVIVPADTGRSSGLNCSRWRIWLT